MHVTTVFLEIIPCSLCNISVFKAGVNPAYLIRSLLFVGSYYWGELQTNHLQWSMQLGMRLEQNLRHHCTCCSSLQQCSSNYGGTYLQRSKAASLYYGHHCWSQWYDPIQNDLFKAATCLQWPKILPPWVTTIDSNQYTTSSYSSDIVKRKCRNQTLSPLVTVILR